MPTVLSFFQENWVTFTFIGAAFLVLLLPIKSVKFQLLLCLALALTGAFVMVYKIDSEQKAHEEKIDQIYKDAAKKGLEYLEKHAPQSP